jgi:hypothetical protein
MQDFLSAQEVEGSSIRWTCEVVPEAAELELRVWHAQRPCRRQISAREETSAIASGGSSVKLERRPEEPAGGNPKIRIIADNQDS